MRPIHQTEFADGCGNCFQACLASILEVELAAVPHFKQLQNDDPALDMVCAADEWLRQYHRKRFISIEMYGEQMRDVTDQCLFLRTYDQDDYVILSGVSPRANADGTRKYHCVVGQPRGWGFQIVHDPHPDGAGLVGQPYGVKWIVPVP